jgi:hypothetical protein
VAEHKKKFWQVETKTMNAVIVIIAIIIAIFEVYGIYYSIHIENNINSNIQIATSSLTRAGQSIQPINETLLIEDLLSNSSQNIKIQLDGVNYINGNTSLTVNSILLIANATKK